MKKEHLDRVLALAQELGNVSEACRQTGISRTLFYEYKRRGQSTDTKQSQSLPAIRKVHPQTTPPAVAARIVSLSNAHPLWGCAKLSKILRDEGTHISAPTLQRILLKNKMGTRQERIIQLENRAIMEGVELSREQAAAIEGINPAFRERHAESSRPGELLFQDTITVGSFKGIGKIYMQVVVDSFASYGFVLLHPKKSPEYSMSVIRESVLPFFQPLGLNVDTITTNSRREYCGSKIHPYNLYLSFNNIEHKVIKKPKGYRNGFIEQFRLVLQDFFRVALQQDLPVKLKDLQAQLDEWLLVYNTSRPSHGYRNMGEIPLDVINRYLARNPHQS